MNELNYNVEQFGTNISDLKSKFNNESYNTDLFCKNNNESEIDYDKILDSLNMSEPTNINNNNNNMHNLTKKIEFDLQNYDIKNNEPMPSNYSKELNNNIINNTNNITNTTNIPNTTNNKGFFENYIKKYFIIDLNNYGDIILFFILFIILNLHVIINFFNNNISIINNNETINLLIRATIFILFYYIINIKKYLVFF